MSKSLAPLARRPRRIPALDLDCVQPFASTSSSITRELLATGEEGMDIGQLRGGSALARIKDMSSDSCNKIVYKNGRRPGVRGRGV